MRKFFFVLLGVLFASALLGADVIPSARRMAWEAGVTVGVPGGIPTILDNQLIDAGDFDIDPTGVEDSYQGFLDAGTAAAADPETYRGYKIPPGTYKVTGPVYAFDGQIVRGSGVDVTIIKPYDAAVATSGITVGGYTPHPFWNQPRTAIINSPSRGATEIDIGADPASYSAYYGKMINISVGNDLTIPVISVAGYPSVRQQQVIFVGRVDANTMLIDRPILWDLPAALVPEFSFAVSNPGDIADSQRNNAGAEDLTVDGEHSTATLVGFSNTYGCWLKNLKVINATNYHVSCTFSLSSEIRHCEIKDRKDPGATTNGAGILTGRMCNALIEDNIITNTFPSIEMNFGSTGNVIAYNYVDESLSGGTIGGSFNSNHGPHNSLNLFEGNIGPRFQTDGYFGSDSEGTVFRNWFHATSATSTGTRFAITLNRFARSFNVVANLTGRTGVGITWQYLNVGVGFNATSSTSHTIGSNDGDRVFAVPSGLLYQSNVTWLIIYSAANPANYMTGRVSSPGYSGSDVNFTSYRSGGSGTFTDWVILGGTGYGNPICYALGGPNIGGGGTLSSQMTGASAAIGLWWWAWDGTPMVRMNPGPPAGDQPNTAYNSGTSYSIGNVVNYSPGTGPFADSYLTSERVDDWIAVNAGLLAEPGQGQTDWLAIGKTSLQDFDYDVYRTVILRGNWNASTESIPSNEAMGGDTYPLSYFRSSKPAFFGSITWPPVDPTNIPADQSTNAVFAVKLPAAWRFINGNSNYLNSTANATVTGTLTTGTLTLP